jgi:hypothetical protein
MDYPRRGISRSCIKCGHIPGFHKCCNHCGATANGAKEIEQIFGFRIMSDSGVSSDVNPRFVAGTRGG